MGDNGGKYICNKFGVDYDMLRLYVYSDNEILRELYFDIVAVIFANNLMMYAL
jgi:hypothetical protein